MIRITIFWGPYLFGVPDFGEATVSYALGMRKPLASRHNTEGDPT